MHGQMYATALLNWMQMLILNENIALLFGTVGNIVYYLTIGVLFLDCFLKWSEECGQKLTKMYNKFCLRKETSL